MVFFIPVLLAVAGIAIYKDRKDRKRERRELEAEATASGQTMSQRHRQSKINRSGPKDIDAGLHTIDGKVPPAYQEFENGNLSLPSYTSIEMPKHPALRFGGMMPAFDKGLLPGWVITSS
ncbi:hypothetical protein M409DRAFT_57689 [Zasmidium cellare ATCC 36951]|uniref:Uncharacterized protein n=1 Tax=Zasmidium cellare ATCC 36951 TaxID=1080233 RepID=A0A6A6CC32_ZASCE|nr:uncharacterized protein M409DRAFT_57689 [Zasmidium cellare ATCC 36951]KAF2163006.1 hypothetical protein M409DRAFT_57689 [Zasmidium cellare ATCC 36951]